MVAAEPEPRLGAWAKAASEGDPLALVSAFSRCGKGDIDRQTALVGLGVSGLEFMRLLANLEDRCAGGLDDAELAQCQTVGDLIDALRRSRRARESFAPKA